MPKVSVIIPVHNTEKYLRECLDSVVNQTLKDIEIICINDGSTDNSQQILEEYARKDNRIRIILQENRGVSSARNTGIANSNGEYISFVDADDYLELNCFDFVFNKLNDESDIVYFGHYDVYMTGKVDKVNEQLLNFIEITNFYDKNILNSFLNECCAKLYKREFLLQNDIHFNEQIEVTEDGLFNLECVFKNPKFETVNYFGYHRIENDNSVTSAKFKVFDKAIKTFTILKDSVFIDANEEEKCQILIKLIGALQYYYNINKHFLCHVYYSIKWTNFRKEFYNLLGKNKGILDKIPNYSFLKSLNLWSVVIKNIFSVRAHNNKKIITILGIKIVYPRRDKNIRKQEKLARILKKEYIDNYLNDSLNFSNIKPKKEFENEKIIWQYWGQGIDDSTHPVVKKCIESVEKNREGYKHIILTNDNISEYLEFPQEIIDAFFRKKYFTLTFFSDLLRCSLLSLYGGIWIDATVYLSKPIPKEYLSLPFFAFQRGERPHDWKSWNKYDCEYFSWNKKSRIRLLSSFMIAKKGYELINALRDILVCYCSKEMHLKHYYLMHIIFNELINTEEFKNKNLPIVSDIEPHRFAINRDKAFNMEQWEKLSNISIHKLSYYSSCCKDSFLEYFLLDKLGNKQND